VSDDHPRRARAIGEFSTQTRERLVATMRTDSAKLRRLIAGAAGTGIDVDEMREYADLLDAVAALLA
jgi:hypothetical protein